MYHLIVNGDKLKEVLLSLPGDRIWTPPGSRCIFRKDALGRSILYWKSEAGEFFIKLFHRLRPGDSRAPYMEWLRLHELRSLGFNTPEPAAFITEYDGLLNRPVRAAVITGRVPGYSLEELSLSLKGHMPPQVVKVLSDTVAKFHGLGFRHRDLYFSHLFYEPSKDRIHLIDFQRVYRAKLPGADLYGLLRDLSQLMYSASSFLSPRCFCEFRRAFFRGYFKHPIIPLRGIPPGLVLMLVEIKRRRIARHDNRRSRGRSAVK
ncbi:Lipopolysaccharide kinase (Kdo/WaaP) family protein [Thermodesulforhabdus norvegica]|uniref:Lipopolysaccharide kinase (Kdo/WaaP) family protein n=1 Tax=Thermodesulforhabdus norvegica TaxID=39841 RepID=A0A1I4U002_9BACT|nr:Lipopolysaccharide kinase (Kdo/WaaP) family protein [Thermodesulforhabdus norvegica]